MVTEMRVVGNKEGEGDDEKDDVGDEGGVRATRKVTLSRKSHLSKFQDPEKVRTIVGMSSTS